MGKYEVSFIIESDEDYADGEQIEELRNDIESLLSDYNCFIQIENVKIRELNWILRRYLWHYVRILTVSDGLFVGQNPDAKKVA